MVQTHQHMSETVGKTAVKKQAGDAASCPWCGRWALKDAACNWVCCGLSTDRGFVAGQGCGRQWCFSCSLKLCGPPMYKAETGEKVAGVSTSHTAACCAAFSAQLGVKEGEFCPGGHNSHKP